MSNTASEIAYFIPEKYRKTLYTVLFVLGVVLGATTAGFGAVAATFPKWLAVAWAVYGYVSTATHYVAKVNTAPEAPSAPR